MLTAEAVVGPYSDLRGRTLAQSDLRRRTGVTVLALLRQGATRFDRIARTRILAGDALLLQGGKAELQALCERRGLVLLSEPAPAARRAVVAVGVLALALASAALGIVPITLAATLAIALAVTVVAATGIVRPVQIYQAMDWRVLVFVGGMLPRITTRLVGDLMAVAQAVGPDPRVVLAVLFVAAAGLTQVLSNVATVIVLAPVAVALARTGHLSPVPLVVTVIVAVVVRAPHAAGNKVHLLVMGPCGYRYGDLVRYGLPLTLALGTLAVVAVPALFPFGPA